MITNEEFHYCKQLEAKIWFLLDFFKEHLEEGYFTFPDGDTWQLKPHRSSRLQGETPANDR